MSVLYVVELHWMIAAGQNDVFEGIMDLTALYKEQIYEEKKRQGKKKSTAISLQQNLCPLHLIPLLLQVSFCPYYAGAYTEKKSL